MRLGAMATLVAALQSIQTNPDYPNMSPDAFAEFMKNLAPTMPVIAYGTAAGTGAAIDVGSGNDEGNEVENDDFDNFTETVLVVVLNKTDGTIFIHLKGMAAASYFEVVAAAAYVGANGITLAANGRGFRLGTAAALNTAADELFWFALGK